MRKWTRLMKGWAIVAVCLALLCASALADSAPETVAVVMPANPLAEESQARSAEGEVFAADPMRAGGEEIALYDEDSQDWYDQLYEEAASYVLPEGEVCGKALRAPGQETLSEVEIEVLQALEGVDIGENEMIDSEGKVNLMLLGIDARPGQTTGRSDAMILCSIDVKNNRIKLVSFMRDMYVSIPQMNPTRMNTAYYKGGFALLKGTMEKNFGISVDHYVAVNFSVLGNLIDQLGGLELNIEDQYFVDRINAVIKNDNLVLGIKETDGLVKKPGLQTLTGKQAQAYARFRYGAKSGGDWARTGRQREVIMKLFEKVTQLSVPEMANLAIANIDQVSTDLTLADLIKLAPVALQLRNVSFEEMRVPEDGDYTCQTINKMSVLVPDFKKIQPKLRDFLAD